MEFLKQYQVVEHKDGLWSVVRAENMIICGVQLRASIEISYHGFHSAAEAQELADELNEEHGYESSNNE